MGRFATDEPGKPSKAARDFDPLHHTGARGKCRALYSTDDGGHVNTLEQMLHYLQQGGFVMWPLLLGAAVLWYGLGYRWLTLRRGSQRSLRTLIVAYRGGSTRKTWGLIDQAVQVGVNVTRSKTNSPRAHLEEAWNPLYEELGRFSLVVKVIVVIAPLAGLLGTVGGMIETFDALGEMSLFRQGGGIAGGIAQALISTQMGLAVAIPGLLMGEVLRRRQTNLEQELEQAKELLCMPPHLWDPNAKKDSFEPSQRLEQEDKAMRFSRRKKTDMTQVDISPLIDMVFILLIFFMVSTTFVKDLKIELERPSASSASRASTKAIRVHVERTGRVYLDGTPTQVWMIQSRLRTILKSDATRPVLVITDRLVQAQQLIEVVDQCRLAGAKDVGVATQREAG